MFYRLDSESVKYVYMIICLDGMASAFHSKADHLWPVVASILNLHPHIRRHYQNVILCMLFYGAQKADFQQFLHLVVEQLSTVFLRIRRRHCQIEGCDTQCRFARKSCV